MTEPLYVRAGSIAEATSLLVEHVGQATLLAGGTDLMPEIRKGLLSPRYVIDIKHVPGLKGIQDEPGGLTIGALTTIREIEISPTLLSSGSYRALADAARSLGSMQVRNRATLGGNLCHGSPSADMAPALVALDATARIAGPRGDRVVPVSALFAGPCETTLSLGEMVVEIFVPAAVHSVTASAYVKHTARSAMDLAIAGAAACVAFDERGGLCVDVRIALGAVAATPIRVQQAEDVVRGRPLEDGVIAAAARVAADACSPISDVRASADYRRAMVQVLTARSLEQARQLAEQTP